MNSTTLFSINEKQVSHNDFEDEVVVIHFESGNYFSLRGAAAVAWNRLAKVPASPSSLLACFVEPPEEAADRIAALLEEMRDRGLLVETASDGTATKEVPVATPAAYVSPEMEAFEDLQKLLVADVIHDADEQGWPYIAADPAA